MSLGRQDKLRPWQLSGSLCLRGWRKTSEPELGIMPLTQDFLDKAPASCLFPVTSTGLTWHSVAAQTAKHRGLETQRLEATEAGNTNYWKHRHWKHRCWKELQVPISLVIREAPLAHTSSGWHRPEPGAGSGESPAGGACLESQV